MSLEQALQENTAALKQVAELLIVSNADRQAIMQKEGMSGTPTPTPSNSSSAPTVAEIKEAVKTADEATLKTMLEEETNGKARSTALDAINAALAEKQAASDEAETADGEAEAAEQEKSAEKAEPAVDDKNAQPVPTEVSGEAIKKAFGNWFGETDDEDERAARRAFVSTIVEKLGGNLSELHLENRRMSIFYLRRKRAGLEVDLDAEYDFNGSPTQDAPAAKETLGDASDDDLL